MATNLKGAKVAVAEIWAVSGLRWCLSGRANNQDERSSFFSPFSTSRKLQTLFLGRLLLAGISSPARSACWLRSLVWIVNLGYPVHRNSSNYQFDKNLGSHRHPQTLLLSTRCTCALLSLLSLA